MGSESLVRRQPLIPKDDEVKKLKKQKTRIGEIAGGTAAEFTAVCCCCPCGLLELVVLAMVRVPAGLCRRAMRRRRLKRRAAAMAAMGRSSKREDDEESVLHERVLIVPRSPSLEEEELEREMWAQFYGTGFWRSPSQRE